MSCQKCIGEWEVWASGQKHLWTEESPGYEGGTAVAAEAEEIKLIAQIPPIQKMDSSLNTLVCCKKLSLSSNSIDKMISLPGLKCLEILSLGRNQIKKISGLEEVGGTLKQLWISYNHITTLDGLHPCTKLEVLFIANNKIGDVEEVAKLNANAVLKNVLFTGNPFYDTAEAVSFSDRSDLILARLGNIKCLDGEMVV